MKTSPHRRVFGFVPRYDHMAAVLLLFATVIFSWSLLRVDRQLASVECTYTSRLKQGYCGRVLAAQASEPETPVTGTSSVDNDPVLGVAEAPVTIIGFVDYECPFCRKFFLQTLPKLKQEYIDQGKVKIVMRDLPIPFHEPAATLESVAANCARQQGGDSKFFEFQEQIYKQTKSNGKGLEQKDVEEIAARIKISSLSLQLCLDDQAVKDEINQDVAAADALGVLGTPTFLIGRSSADGQVTGTVILGAQSVEEFEATINQLL